VTRALLTLIALTIVGCAKDPHHYVVTDEKGKIYYTDGSTLMMRDRGLLVQDPDRCTGCTKDVPGRHWKIERLD
jgi:hypothetical protein